MRPDLDRKIAMFKVLPRTKYGRIGLDVGTECIRMLQLAVMQSTPLIAAAAQWRFPDAACGPGADLQTRERLAAEGVREMLRSGAFRGRDVVSCLRAGEINIKNVRMPSMPDSELASAVVWECRERFGFDVTPDRVHCIRAGEVRQGTEAHDEVILMAVPEESIQRHLKMLSGMSLRPIHIDSEPTALFRAYQRFLRRVEDASSVTVIVDIGLASTKVVVARGKTILLIKNIDIAGLKFNESVARELNMTYSEAAGLRRRNFEGKMPGLNDAAETTRQDGTDGKEDKNRERIRAEERRPEDENKIQWSVFDAIREQVEALAREISLCLRYCSVTFRGLRPESITLTGGEAYDKHLVRSFNEYLDCKCVVGQPLRGIDLGKADLGGDRRKELPEWSVAVGLALRDVNGKIEYACE